MKRTSIFIISILIMLGASTISFAYSDTDGHWADETIEELSGKKIIYGYSDGTFKPDSSMTRAEFIVVMNRLLGLKVESSKYIPDVSRQEWFYSDIRKAVEARIITGDADGYIRPNDKITREEAVVVLSRALNIANIAGSGMNFDDKDEISDWAMKTVYTFTKYGYIKGYEGNLIKPKDSITRAEVLTIIKRIIPNILTENIYEGMISGNTLLIDNNIVLNKVTISGNLMIKEGITDTLKINNVEVKGNLIIDKQSKLLSQIRVGGKIIETSSKRLNYGKDSSYMNKEFGISFALPKTTTIVEINKGEEVDFSKEDVIAINILKDDKYYLQSVLTIARKEIKKYANLFVRKEIGNIQNAQYVFYDDNDKSQMIIIKRENVVYELAFYNAVSENLVDNVLSTLQLIQTENIVDHKDVVYKNSALSLKFLYKEFYVLVDDSYNTGIMNENEALFKLFVQVNTVTDMENYTMKEVKNLLTSIARNDGEITKVEDLKIINNEAIRFVIKGEDRIINSLYIVVGNNLYNLIFTGEIDAMNEVGNDMFTNIINTIEI